MEFFRFCPVKNDLYYKHYDENGKYLSGGVVKNYKDKESIDLGNDYFFYNGLFKRVDDNTFVVVPFELYMLVNDIVDFCSNKDIALFNVYIDEDFFVIEDKDGNEVYKKPLRFYINNNSFNINGSFVYHADNGDANIEFEFSIDVFSNKSYCFLYIVVDDVKLWLPYSYDFSKVAKLFIPEYIKETNNILSDVKVKLTELVESGLDLTPVKNELDDISTKLNSFKCDVDLSSVEDKLNDIDNKISNSGKFDLSSIQDILVEISKKVDVLNVLDITNKIDEKLGQLFNLKSLNGSNGSKFKDGEEVLVKGYAGKWKVEGSYPLLNNDGLTIIVYRLSQDGRVLLAPSPFVSSSEG